MALFSKGLFGNRKAKNDVEVVNEEVVEEKIKTVDLNKVVSIYININDRFFSSRFFVGKKHGGENYELIIGIKEVDLVKVKDYLKLTYNLLNSDRYIQHGLVEEKDGQLITISLDEDIVKLEEKRKNIKICCDLKGSILILNREISVSFKNISIGGAFIETEYEFPINHSVRLHIDNLDIATTAIVLRKQKNTYGTIEGYGCRFDNLNESQEESIAQFINWSLSKERETLISRDVYNYIYDDFKNNKF